MDVGQLTKAAIERLEGGRPGPASAPLPRTERRDVVTAESTHRETRRHGRVVQTTYRLNGDRISQRAAELLLEAFGPGTADRHGPTGEG